MRKVSEKGQWGMKYLFKLIKGLFVSTWPSTVLCGTRLSGWNGYGTITAWSTITPLWAMSATLNLQDPVLPWFATSSKNAKKPTWATNGFSTTESGHTSKENAYSTKLSAQAKTTCQSTGKEQNHPSWVSKNLKIPKKWKRSFENFT